MFIQAITWSTSFISNLRGIKNRYTWIVQTKFPNLNIVDERVLTLHWTEFPDLIDENKFSFHYITIPLNKQRLILIYN